ncbi:MAG: DciA family protein [Devosia sp.]
MASKAKEPEEPKRLNRTVGVAEALGGVLDSALKRRGFATRDILIHWPTIAPRPYDQSAMPEELKWPRGAGHEGATLYLRCAEGHRLALAHEGPLIAAAVNRYFGYFLVRDVKLSIEPFRRGSAAKAQAKVTLPEVAKHADQAVAEVQDPALKDALKGLGEAVFSRKAR